MSNVCTTVFNDPIPFSGFCLKPATHWCKYNFDLYFTCDEHKQYLPAESRPIADYVPEPQAPGSIVDIEIPGYSPSKN